MTVSDTGDEDSTEGFRFNGNGIRAGFSGALILDDQEWLVGVHLGATDNDGIYGRAVRMSKAFEVLSRRLGVTMNRLNFGGESAIDPTINSTGMKPALSTGVEAKRNGTVVSPLTNEIRKGNHGSARTLLSKGADPNLGSPLTAAVEAGDAEMVRMLFARGAKIELAAHPQDSSGLQIEVGVALLYSAVVRNNVDVAKVLVEHGLNPNGAVPRYGNLLTVAGWRSNAEMVEFLLSQGARADEVGDHANGTALHGAVFRGDLGMTKSLVAAGSSLRALSRPQIGETPLGLAYIHLTDEGDRRAVFDFLLSSERTRPEDRMHVLALALEDGNLKIAQQILAMEIAPNRDKGEQPLNGAIRLGDPVLVERLVKMGVDVNAPDRRGATPFLVLTRTHNLLVASKCRIFKLLVDRGATLSYPKAEDDVKELQSMCSQAQ